MKCHLLLVAIGISFFSCQLADGGRMANLSLNVQSSDLTSKLLSSEDSIERMILPDMNRLELILYKDFSGDLMDENSPPSQAATALALEQPDTISTTLTFEGEGGTRTLGDIPPGTWNILVAGFTEDTTGWEQSVFLYNESSEMRPSCYGYRLLENVKLVPGVNLLEAYLKPNVERTENLMTGDTVSTFGTSLSYGQSSILERYILLNLEMLDDRDAKMAKGQYFIYLPIEDYTSVGGQIFFFNQDGEQTSVNYSTTNEQFVIDYNGTDTYIVILVMTPLAPFPWSVDYLYGEEMQISLPQIGQ